MKASRRTEVERSKPGEDEAEGVTAGEAAPATDLGADGGNRSLLLWIVV